MALKWYGREINASMTQAAVNGLNAGAAKVQEEAKRRTPYRSGALRASLKVAEANAGKLEAAVYTSNPYAIYQHEIFSYRRNPGQPKFLESAANDYRRQFQGDMLKAITGALGRYA